MPLTDTVETTQVPLESLPTTWDDERLLSYEPFLTHFVARGYMEREHYNSRRSRGEVQEGFYSAIWDARGDMASYFDMLISRHKLNSNSSTKHMSNGLVLLFKRRT